MYIDVNSLFLSRNSAHSYLFVASFPFELNALDLKPRLLCIGFFWEAGIPNFKMLAPPLEQGMQWQRVEASWWSSSIIIRPLLLCSSICIA
jgi:hypothetical protein